jgi:hypothetical protein
MEIESLHDCAHFRGSGTCKSGADLVSCRACVKKNELRGGPYVGLACGTCNGLGRTTVVGGVIGYYFSSRRDG